MKNWLSKLLSGEIVKVAEEKSTTTFERIKNQLAKNAYVKQACEDKSKEEAIPKAASVLSLIDKDRRKHIESLSDTNLAHLLTELSLIDDGENVQLGYVKRYQEKLEEVLKNRKKGEEELYKLVPKHTLSKKAALTQIWTVQDVDGKESIVRLFEDLPKEADTKELCTTLLSKTKRFSTGDKIKNESFESIPVGEIGTIERFDYRADKKYSILCKFAQGNYWVSPDQIEGSLKKEATKESEKSEKESHLQEQVEIFENELAKAKEEGRSTTEIEKGLKEAKKLLEDTKRGSTQEEDFAGQAQKTDDPRQQIPAVYRTPDQDYTSNTKDFGEVYHQDKLAPEKISKLDKSSDEKSSDRPYHDEKWRELKRKEMFEEEKKEHPTLSEDVVHQIVKDHIGKGIEGSLKKEGGFPPVSEQDAERMRALKLNPEDQFDVDKYFEMQKVAEKIQYVDETGKEIRQPEELGAMNDPKAPEEINVGGKKYKKQVVQADIKLFKPLEPKGGCQKCSCSGYKLEETTDKSAGGVVFEF